VLKSLNFWLNGDERFRSGLVRSGSTADDERIFRRSQSAGSHLLAQVESMFRPHAFQKPEPKDMAVEKQLLSDTA